MKLLNFKNGKPKIHQTLRSGAINRQAKTENVKNKILPLNFTVNHLGEVVISISSQPHGYDEVDVQLLFTWFMENNPKCKDSDSFISDYYTTPWKINASSSIILRYVL